MTTDYCRLTSTRLAPLHRKGEQPEINRYIAGRASFGRLQYTILSTLSQ